MRRCLDLAKHGRGAVGNGALVGAVLVRDGEVIAEGFHAGFGQAHAERSLLEKFEQKIDSRDVLYVNLEPCCHHGKTPPCTDILLERGIKHVVIGMQDPDFRVGGKGIELLRKAGVEVIGPVLPELSQRLNRGFVSVRTLGRPWVTLKRAQTTDGRVATPDGKPLQITSNEQYMWSHEWLRSGLDSIVVGVQTVVTDDPSLNTRFDQKKRGLQPWRIILDPHLRIPLGARVVTDEARHRTIVFIGDAHSPSEISKREQVLRELSKRGVLVRKLPLVEGRFVWKVLWADLLTPRPDYDGVTSVLVEGGPKTWEMFREAGIVDEEVVLTGKDND